MKTPTHLTATPAELSLTEFEQALICSAEAFYRFAGALLGPDGRQHRLSGADCVVLQLLMTAGRPRQASDLMRFANRDDAANVGYSLKKLIKAGLVEKCPGTAPRETAYRITTTGEAASAALVARRRQLIAEPLVALLASAAPLGAASELLGLVTGLYDRGARVLALGDS